MLVPFDKLPESSRLWIFQAEQKFNHTQLTIINANLELFINNWQTHGKPLEGSFKIIENCFIIIAINESVQRASGCSIDESVHTMKEISRLVNQDLLRRDLVSFKLGENQLQTVKVPELKNAFKSGIWNENTLTFNTLVSNKGELENRWLVPASTTWLKRYIIKQEVTH